ncbi:probable WRKY transcription factor 35 [Phragmites australis]|uniref:probable WRKY transcription factor 35 n=1 Tax=Phragmites australis TaxID=29695 RepID=UPI002D77A359|nr:probable WRKY transcription factor 35 [Phragmites australis]
MCDYFLQRMEGDHQAGDLTDIVRAGGAMQVGVAELPSTATGWQHQAEPELATLFPPPQPSSSDGAGPCGDGFGDAFVGLPDPYFTSDYRNSSGGAADFFDFEAPVGGIGGGGSAGVLVDSGGGGVVARGVQSLQMPALSPLSPRAIRPYPVMMGCETVNIDMPMAGLAVGPPCAFDAVAGLQMPSPRAGGIKRRKNQARKVVCIPAPAASAGGKATGEVVPSDLWAWRKYGQKPIKGSPFPRGYYRCSSSKGCPARKQVERSRTDPSMLVITYNSDHNHPWPTQRNALAGSTRSHQAKNNGNNPSASKKHSSHNLQKPVVKVEPDQTAAAATTTAATSTTTTATTSTSNSTPRTMAVKEEAMVGSEMEKGTDHGISVTLDHGDLMQQMFSQSYGPMIPEGGHHDDFFADLAELESDPMSLIFSKE